MKTQLFISNFEDVNLTLEFHATAILLSYMLYTKELSLSRFPLFCFSQFSVDIEVSQVELVQLLNLRHFYAN